MAAVARVAGLSPEAILYELPYPQGLQYQTIDLARNGARFTGAGHGAEDDVAAAFYS